MRNVYRVLLMVLIVSIAVFATACGKNANEGKPVIMTVPQGEVFIKILDIGQGDAILIRTEVQTILVDTGDVANRERLVQLLKANNVKTIDKLILTHAHADHIGGVPSVLEQFAVRQVYDSGMPTTTALYQQYLGLVKRKQIPFSLLGAGESLDLGGGARFQVLAPGKPYLQEAELNNSSIVSKLIFGEFSMLLTGDAEKESEQRMLQQAKHELKSTVLKSAHHGSSTSSTAAFLKAVQPELIVISLGANNDYHHPHPSVMKRYSDMKIPVLRTDQQGTITIKSDGKKFDIIKEKG